MSSLRSPATAKLWPSPSSMTVETRRVLTLGMMNPCSETARVKSSSETSGLTIMLIFPLPRTVGVKFRPTPKVLYSMVIVVPPPLDDCGTGIGNSPPARKLAGRPLWVISVGSARTFVRPFSFSASMTPVHVAPAPVNRKSQFALSPMVRGLPGQPPTGSLVRLLSREIPKFAPLSLM